MKWRHPFTIYVAVVVLAPTLFILGMFLFNSDRELGEPLRVTTGGAIGVAANLSLTGINSIARFLISFGPQLLILIGLALPIAGTMYTVQRIDVGRGPRLTVRRRSLLWSVACFETFAMLGLFVFAFENIPT